MKRKNALPIILLAILIFATIPTQTFAQQNPFEGIAEELESKSGGVASFGETGGSGLFDFVGAIANAILNVLINIIFQPILAITAAFWLLAAILLQYVLSPEFLGMPITSPKFEIVYKMWQTVRDFSNMFFVLALVAIGLGTALKYGEYQLQKALPRLIFIALLINFTPVIVGFFIDAANITMRFLVSETAGDTLIQMALRAYDANGKLITSIFNNKAMENLAAAMAQTVFNIVGTLMYLIYFILYVMRYVALLILFILSPLAFFSFILPATRRFWHHWWEQFIAWNIIGISSAFFVLLAAQFIGFMWNTDVNVKSGVFQAFTDFINLLIIGMIPVIILVIGLFYSMQAASAAAGASRGLNFAKIYVGRRIQKGVVAAGRGKLIRIAEAEKRKGRMAVLGREIPGTGVVREAKWLLGAPVRLTARQFLPYLKEAEMREIEREREEAKKIITPEYLRRKFKAAGPGARFRGSIPAQIGRLLAAAETGKLKDLRLSDETERKLLEEMMTRQPSYISQYYYYKGGKGADAMANELSTKFPEASMQKAGLWMTPEEHQEYGSLERKFIATAKPRHIENWSRDVLLDNTGRLREEIKIALREHGTGEQLATIARTFGREAVQKIMEYLNKEVGREWLEKHNAPLLKYLQSNAAGILGYRAHELSATGTVPPKPGSSSPPPTAEVQQQRRKPPKKGPSVDGEGTKGPITPGPDAPPGGKGPIT